MCLHFHQHFLNMHWNQLPALCLWRICTFSGQFNSLRLACKHFHSCLPLPKELMDLRCRKTKGYMLRQIAKKDTSIATMIWFIRFYGVTSKDIIHFTETVLPEKIQFLAYLYKDHAVDFIKLFDSCALCPHGLKTMRSYIDLCKDLKIQIPKTKHKNWFASACWSGDTQCMQYIKDEFNIQTIKLRYILMYIFKSKSVAAWEWFMQAFDFETKEIIDSCCMRYCCRYGNLNMARHIYNKYKITVDGFDCDMSCFILASRSNDLNLLMLVEEMYAKIHKDIPHIQKHKQPTLLTEIFRSATINVDIIDYIFNKYKIKPDGYIMRKLCSRGAYEAFTVMIKKFNLTIKDAHKWNLVEATNSRPIFKVLYDEFRITKENTQISNHRYLTYLSTIK